MSEQKTVPRQKQSRQPGREDRMQPRPDASPRVRGCERLKDKTALITGGDSGIGRAVAVAFAREGADVSLVYLDEHEDARETQKLVQKEGRKCLLIAGDIGYERFCREAVDRTVKELKRLDILINNAAEQHPQDRIEDIDREQLERTFRTNIFGMFFMTKAALKHLKKGCAIVNTASITAYRGNPTLLDYSATKGAIVAFTRSLSLSLAERGIRVNAVAPGPIWTPLIPSTFDPGKVETFGSDVPMKRPGQPNEVATCYVFLVSDEATYISGQTLHPNGGEVVNG